MREIKFRAWNKKKKEMELLGSLSAIYACEGDCIETDNLIYLQFTGLKDKNGKEVYEGDIIRHNTNINSPFSKKYTLVIEDLFEFFEDKGYALSELCESYNPENLEVIGNIYENPELLKEEK